MVYFSEVFGERLKELCLKEGKSLWDLCNNFTGLSFSNLKSYVHDSKLVPETWELIEIAEYFGVSIDYLLGMEAQISMREKFEKYLKYEFPKLTHWQLEILRRQMEYFHCINNGGVDED